MSHDSDPYSVLFLFPRIWIHWSKQQKYIWMQKTMYTIFHFRSLLEMKRANNTHIQAHTKAISFQMHGLVCMYLKCFTKTIFMNAIFPRRERSNALKWLTSTKNIQSFLLTTVFLQFLLFFFYFLFRADTIGLSPFNIKKNFTCLLMQKVKSVPFLSINCYEWDKQTKKKKLKITMRGEKIRHTVEHKTKDGIFVFVFFLKLWHHFH